MDIARAMGMAKSSLYHYFPEKRALLMAVLEEGMDPLLDGASEIQLASLEPSEELRALLRRHAIQCEEKLTHLLVYLREYRTLDSPTEALAGYVMKRRRYDDAFVATVKRGQAAGLFIQGDARVIVYGLLGMYNWMVQWYRPGHGMEVGEIAAVFEDMALRAITAGAS